MNKILVCIFNNVEKSDNKCNYITIIIVQFIERVWTSKRRFSRKSDLRCWKFIGTEKMQSLPSSNLSSSRLVMRVRKSPTGSTVPTWTSNTYQIQSCTAYILLKYLFFICILIFGVVKCATGQFACRSWSQSLLQ